jgi:hypothetical protein
MKHASAALVAGICLLGAAQANGQPTSPVREVSFTAGTSLGDGGPALALAAGLAFRWGDRLGILFELAYARKLKFEIDLCPPPRVCVLGGAVPGIGRTLALVPHVAFDLLPSARRMRLVVLGGAGAGHVRQRYFVGPLNGAPELVEFTRSDPVLAWSAGARWAIQVNQRFAVGVDVRSLHLLQDAPTPDQFITPANTLDTVRLGAHSIWRF